MHSCMYLYVGFPFFAVCMFLCVCLYAVLVGFIFVGLFLPGFGKYYSLDMILVVLFILFFV